AAAELVNGTLVGNGAGALAHGAFSIHSSIVTGNETGLWRDGQGTLASRYNDLASNRAANYQGVQAGAGDISVAVAFAAAARHDFRLTALQPTTDRGDPADDFSAEPTPNGGRVNMGAFGNTTGAELSASATPGWTAGEPAADGAGGCSMGG